LRRWKITERGAWSDATPVRERARDEGARIQSPGSRGDVSRGVGACGEGKKSSDTGGLVPMSSSRALGRPCGCAYELREYRRSRRRGNHGSASESGRDLGGVRGGAHSRVLSRARGQHVRPPGARLHGGGGLMAIRGCGCGHSRQPPIITGGDEGGGAWHGHDAPPKSYGVAM
jgi:hypothetical protein